MNKSNLNLKHIVKCAGGLKAVADSCGVKYQSVQKWIRFGLPRTEYTGETRYAEILSKMSISNGECISEQEIREVSLALRNRKNDRNFASKNKKQSKEAPEIPGAKNTQSETSEFTVPKKAAGDFCVY